MGETGIAASGNISSFDLNPAAHLDFNGLNFSLSQKIKLYSYNLTRISSTVGGTTFVWDKTQWMFEHASISYPVNENLVIGIGVFQKLNPQMINKKRAVTFSDLFSQETSGSVYSAAGSICCRFSNSFSAGINIYKYFGSITSNIVGDNHGNDADKWANLQNTLSGLNFKFGALLKQKDWSAGLTIELPFKMDVEAVKQISADQLYKSLFPDYDRTDWNLPLIVGTGFSYNGIDDWILEADFESRQYKSSDVQLNLYEFGGKPEWGNINILRLGVQYIYITEGDLKIPVRAGYAFIPQLYCSINATGLGNVVTDYQNTDRNIKHLFTLGTSITIKRLTVDLTLEYSILKWHQTLKVPQTINDDYSESNYLCNLGIIFSVD